MSRENPTDDERAANALAELKARKEEREGERRSRSRRYGILNRKDDLSRETIRKARLNCNCGAAIVGGIHKENCPVIQIARGNR